MRLLAGKRSITVGVPHCFEALQTGGVYSDLLGSGLAPLGFRV